MVSVQERVALTQDVKQTYADAIGILFGGVLTATADQINDQVVEHVDTMLREIVKCSEKITSLSFDLFYKIVVEKSGVRILGELFEKIANKVKEYIEDWVKTLSKNYQFAPCLAAALVNWKSTIEIDLLGI